MSARRFLAALALLGLLGVVPTFGLWRTLKTASFTLFYPQGREREAWEALEVLETYRGYVQQRIGGEIHPVAVVLEDVGSESNGLADTSFHRILLFLSPPSEGTLAHHQNWWRLVGVHEYAHWQHLVSRSGLPALVVALFGTSASPGQLTPDWLAEGVAVYLESGLTPAEGRLNEGSYTALGEVLAREGELPSLVRATFAPLQYPAGSTPYLFGGLFVSYLARTYGEGTVARFLQEFASSPLSYLSSVLPLFGLDRSARLAFGRSLPELWGEWQRATEREAEGFVPPGRQVTHDGYSLASPLFHDGSLYYQRWRPEKPAAFSELWSYELVRVEPSSGKQEVLLRSTAPFVGPLRLHDGVLYYGLQEVGFGYTNRELGSQGTTAVLCALELATGRSRCLLEAAFRSFDMLPGGEVLLSVDRREGFGSEIYLLDGGGHAGPGETDPAQAGSGRGAGSRPALRRLLSSDFLVREIANDGERVLVSARRQWESFRIYRVEPHTPWGEASALEGEIPLPELVPLAGQDGAEAPGTEGQICLCGELLLYSRQWAGRSTGQAFDLGEGSAWRPIRSSYARSPAYDPQGGRLYYLALGPEGYDIYEERMEPPVLEAAPPAEAAGAPVPAASATVVARPAGELPNPLPALPPGQVRHGGYWDNLATLVPRLLFPVLSTDLALQHLQAGAGIAGVSALGDFQYLLAAYYLSQSGRAELELDLQSLVLAPLLLTLSYASFPYGELSASAEWPLYRSLRPGLSAFTLGLQGRVFGPGFSRKQLEPFAVAGLQAPSGELSLLLSLPLERAELGSSENGLALLGGLSAAARLGSSQLSLSGAGVCDFSGALWGLSAIRGYAEGLPATLGAALSCELSLPLLRIRQGLWNPGFFLEDLFLVPFLDAAANQRRELQLGWGAELQLEIKVLAQQQGIPLELSAGFVVNLQGDFAPLLQLELRWPLRGEIPALPRPGWAAG